MDSRAFVETNWVVLTGPPSSGKTSVALELSRRGVQIKEDEGRKLLEKVCGANHRRQLDAETETRCQYQIAQAKLARLSEADPSEPIAWDYGPACSIAWMRIADLPIPRDLLDSAQTIRFAAIFLFEPILFVEDKIRTEHAERDELFEELLTVYKELGYDPIKLPAFVKCETTSILMRTERVQAVWAGHRVRNSEASVSATFGDRSSCREAFGAESQMLD